jgi:sugar lactone lactonase YvrE
LVTVPAALGQGIISTVAGKPWVFTGDGGPATNAPLGGVAGTATDSSGNLYVADPDNNIVVKVTPGGTLTIVAGGPGMTPLVTPGAVAIDASGNLYVAEPFAFRVSKIGSGGVATVVAGNGTMGFTGDNGPATAAQLNQPSGLAIDSGGNLYISDSGNNRIRKVSGGVITTYAGNGAATYAGDDGPAASASLNYPRHIALDSAGNLYIADYGNGRIRKVDHTTQYISTVAGGGSVTTDGAAATMARLFAPAGIAVDSGGNLFIADVDDYSVRKVTASSGLISTVAGTHTIGFSGDNGPATLATLNLAGCTTACVAVDSSGNLFIADTGNLRIRKVNSSQIISTFAGNGKYRFDGDGGQATASSLFAPIGVAFDSAGNLYIGDHFNNRVRKVTPGGIISTFAGNGLGTYAGDGGQATLASLKWPNYVAVDSAGNVYIAVIGNNVVRKVTPAGIISTFAGGGGSLGDFGPATQAMLNGPSGLAFDAAGSLYIAEWSGHRVRRVDTGGIVTTVAGSTAGTSGSSGDGGPASLALLNGPEGLAVDSSGNIYIGDGLNNRVRKILFSTGIITTVAGTGTAGYSGDSGQATLAQLRWPTGVAVDPSGVLYISEYSNARVRRVATTGIISTVAGGGASNPGDGLLATDASLWAPAGIALDTTGNLYLAEMGPHRVRKITNPSNPAFGLSVSPSSQTVNAGLPASYTVTITAGGGFSGSVLLSCSGLPSGASCSFSPNPTAPGASALTVTTTAGSTPAGTTTFTIIGTSSTLSYSTSAKLTVTTNPDFLISVSPGSQTVAAGLKTTYTVNITGVNGFTSGVVLSCSAGLPSGASCSFSPNPTASTATLTVGTSISTPLTGATLTITGAAGTLSHSTSTMLVVTTAAAPASLAYVSGNNQSGPAGAALPNPLVVKVTDASSNPIAGVTVSFAVTAGGGTVTPTSATTDINGIAQAGWVLGAGLGTNTATATVTGLSTVTFSATATVPAVGPGITTVAGSTWVFPTSAIGGQATNAPLGSTYGVAVDGGFNLYVADRDNNMVFKVTTAGVLSVVAGTGTAGFSGDSGQATAARLSWPQGLALDSSSANLYIADSSNNRIRKLNLASGIISTVAGTGSCGYSGDSGQATSAQLCGPTGVFADTYGNLYIADSQNNRVRKVNASGIISTVAGNGTSGTSGDGGLATSAQLDYPRGVAVDSVGNLYIGDDCVRKVNTGGIISTVPGACYGWIDGLAMDSAGNLYIAASGSGRIVKMDTGGALTTVAGTGSWGFSGDNGPATSAELNIPAAVAVDSTGNVYIADSWNYRVRKVSGGTITTIAGNGLYKYGGDSGTATAAYLNEPYGVVGDTAGNLYIADGNRIRKVDKTTGNITTIAGTGAAGYSGDNGQATAAKMFWTTGVVLDGGGNLYIADSNTNRVRKLNLSTGVITTAAGGGSAFPGDGGPATAVALGWVSAVALDTAGNLYIAGGYRIRKVNTSGVITTVAGNGSYGYSGDGGPATAAMLSSPGGVAVDASGNVFIADSSNYRVRKVDTSGTITTVAGNGTSGSSGDGGPATAATLYASGISVDASGNLYIAASSRIRKVTPGGVISTVAGTGSYGFAGDGGPAISAQLNSPQGVWVNTAGDLFIADTYNDRIRLVSNSIAQPDFSLALTPASQSVAAGLSTSYTVQVTGIAGFTSPVALAISGLPSNTTYSFSSNPAAPGNVTLLVNTSINTPLGSSTITVTGTSGSLIRVATATLTRTTAAAPATLTIFSGNNQSGAAGAPLPSPVVVKVADSSGNPIAGVGVSFSVTGGGGSLGSTGVTTGSDGQAATAWILGTTPATNRTTATVTGLSTVTFTATGTQAPAGPGITTIAGSNWVFTGAGGAATSAPFGTLQGTAVDSAGNVYVADSDNDMVFKITPGGTLSIVAGTGVAGAIGDGGPATNAQLNFPNAVAVDSSGNVYIADRDNHRIRKVTSGGIITTLAGGSSGYAGDSGPAALAQFYYPAGVAVDTAGNLYIADRDNHVIRKISAGGIVSTVAGSGISGYSGDSGSATAAQLNSPNGVAVDSAGNLYIADTSNHRIRQVTPAGTISTVAGTGTAGYTGDSGAATSARLNSPSAVTVDSSGNLYIADQSNHRIRKVTSGGTISTLAGSGTRTFSGDGGQATSAALNAPYGVAVDSSGNVYIADQYNYRIRKIDLSGMISTFGGNGLYRMAGDGGLATSAQLSTPRGTVMDSAGNLYIADYANHRVRKVAPGGTITTIAGTGVYGYSGDNGPATSAKLAYPGGVALDAAGNLYVGDQGNHRVRKIDTSGVITTVVGTGSAGSSGDGGLATAAQLNNPRGVAFDSSGNLYIADSSNNRVRKVTPGGTITTVAGSGTSGYAGDGSAATLALLRAPWGVAVDTAGSLYIAEHDNHTVRKVDPSGTISTLAGTGSYGCSGNAVAAASSTFYNVLGVAVDAAGNVYFADENCHRVRKVTPAGVAITVAGTGSAGFSGDGGPAYLAQLRNPQGVWADAAGNVYISDSLNHRIRLVSSSVSVPDFALSLSPASQTAAAGVTAGFTATVAASGGFNSPVNLSCSGLPVGASCSFSPNPAVPGNSTLKLSVPLNATPATFNFTVIGTSGALIRVATGSVTSTSPAALTALTIFSGDNQSAPAGHELPNPIVVQVAGTAGNLLAGVAVSFSVASGGGSLSQTLVRTDGNGQAQTVWTLGTYPGTNTVTATVAGLSPVTFTSSGTLASAGPGIITVAGSTWSFSGAGGPATSAPLGYIWKMAMDAAGNLFVADGGNYMVLKISTAGIVTVVAGTGTSGFSGDGGPATSAQLASVVGVAVDSSGNVYITEQSNQRIRKVDTSGIISTVAGNGKYGYSGDGGPATLAQLGSPNGLAVDAAGNLYIADSSNNRVRKVTPGGVISTVAGTGIAGFTGDGGPASFAQLRNPNAVAFDAAGNMFIADWNNHRVRKVDSSGIITTVAGTGSAGYTTGGGSATSARLYNPNGLAVDASGNVYIADQNNNRIRKVTSAGAISTVAGNGARGFWGDGGPATLAALNLPYGVAVDASGNVYIADSYNYRIRKVGTSGNISTIGGNGMFRYGGDSGPATSAQLYSPRAAVTDAAGNIYIADTSNHRIRKVTPGGAITTFAGTGLPGYSGDSGPATAAMLNTPSGVAVDTASNIYIVDTNNNRIRKVDSTGTITTVAGMGSSTHSGDGGPATLAGINVGVGLAVDAAGNLYIADWNHRIRKVNPAGIISTIAGTGTYGYGGDGGPATAAMLYSPYGLAVDAAGNLYIADQYNYRIRKVDTGGIITTVAGTGTYACSGASGPAASLSLTYPYGLALDSAGNLYFADYACHRIRKLTPGGAISTVAGTGSSGFSGDGGPAIAAMLYYPAGVWLDAAGSIFVADSSNHRIREISMSVLTPDFTVAVSPGSATLAAGLSSTHTVTITALNGLNSYVMLGCSGLPAGASCSFSPRGLVSGTSTLTLSTGVGTPTGTVSFSVAASGGGLVRVAPASLTVTTAVAPASLVVVSGNDQTGPAGSTLPNMLVVKVLDAASNPVAGVPISLTVTAGGGSFQPVSPKTGPNGQAPFTWTLGSSTGANSATASVAGLTPVTLSAIASAPLTGPPITTIAGRAWLFSGDGGPATSAWGIAPMYGVTPGPSGSVYVAATENNLVFKVSSAGILTIVAGNGIPGFSGDGGLAISAQLNGPYRVLADAAGNLYIADHRNHRVRKVSANGTITTVAGNGAGSYSGDGGPATAAGLVSPAGLALDAAGNLYIADMDDHRIRKVNTSGTITTVGGIGIAGYYGDGGQAAFAQFSSPSGLAIDASGNLYVADSNNNRIRKINTAGTATTVAGNGNYGYSGDGGAAVNASLQNPLDVAVDSSGSLYIADRGNNRIRKITSGTISTIVGNGIEGFSGDAGPATAASLSNPGGVAVDSAGNVYIADGDNFRVRKVAVGGTITTIAGNGNLLQPLGDGGPATGAFLLGPAGLALDASGNLYIGEDYVGRVRKVTPGGTISTYAGSGLSGPVGDGGPATAARLSEALGIVVDSAGNLYIAEGHGDRIRKVTTGGIISTIAGLGSAGFSGDGGPATAANLNYPAGLALDAAGNLYFSDQYNYRIRKIDLSGTITTVAGTGAASYYGDTGPAMAAAFNQPGGIAFDSSGNLYIADQANNRIRKIDTGGTVTTVAGSSTAGCGGDGGPALGASLTNPIDVRIDAAGNLYIVDMGCDRIRKVTPGGVITTVAGTGVPGFSGDGGPAVNAQLAGPAGILLDAAGNILISDMDNLRVRKVWSGGAPPTDFALGISPVWRAAPVGSTTSFAVTIAPMGGFSAPVSLTCGGLPAGASCTFSPNPANPGMATLIVSVGSALSGMFTFSVTGTSGSLVHTEGAGVTVTPPPASLSVVSGNNQIGPAGATLPNPVMVRAIDANGVPVAGAQVTFSTSSGVLVPALAATDPNGVASAGWTLAPAAGANSGTATTPGLSPVSLAATGTTPGTPLGITTVAGSAWTFYGDKGPATSAALGILQAVTMDSAGNVYGADAGNNIIVKISPAGTLTVVAGNGTAGYAGDSGPATAAQLNFPSDVAVDAAGNLYIADSLNHRIRKVDAAGNITTVAGNGTAGFSGDNGPAAAAVLNSPYGLAIDSGGNLYIADSSNNRIRRVSPAGTIATVAGGGAGLGDGGPATSAMLAFPIRAVANAAGDLYIADFGNARIRKVNGGGVITTVAGNGTVGFSGDGGPATQAQLNQPWGLALDAAGNLYIPDSYNSRLRRVDSSGVITTIAGTGVAGYSGDGGPATAATLYYPESPVIDASGNIYLADTGNGRIRKITATGTISNLAGNGAFKFDGDGGPATRAHLNAARAIVLDGAGNLVIADSDNYRIRKVDSGGTVTTIAGVGFGGFSGDSGPATQARFNRVWGLAVDSSGNLYLADRENSRVRKITPAAVITTIAGNGVSGSAGDGGQATLAQLNNPKGLALDSAGNLYIGANMRLRKVSTSGVISTPAGTGVLGYSGDGGPATSAQVGNIMGVRLDAAGNVYFADTTYNVVRKIDTGGIITTVAGNGASGYSGDGGPATLAQLQSPRDVAFDAASNLYINDNANYRVRMVTPGGIITTVAGNGVRGVSGDGGVATAASLYAPAALAVDAAGNVYVADGDRVRKLWVFTNPVPAVSALSPTVAPVGAALTLIVTGSGFSPGSVVRWSGSDRPTTFVSTTQLTAAIPASDLAAAGTAQITVFNPAPGGGLSNALDLTIVTPNPLPVISSISPVERTVGSGGFLLTVSGLGFVAGATVQWAGSPRPTTYVSGSQLTAQISDADAATAGMFLVTVVNPGPGGGTSAGLPFTIHPSGSYLVGDASPASGNDSGHFGDESLDNPDLILALRAVTNVPGFLPPNCADLFDAMDSYPADGATRGGDGALDNLDLIATLRRVTNADPSRPRRTTRGLVCGALAPGLAAMLARPADVPLGAGAVEFQREPPAEDGAERVAVYLSAYQNLDLGGLSLALGWTDSSPAAQATLRFISATAGAPALLDNRLPGTIAVAWLGGLQLRAGQRLLLGFVDVPAAGQRARFGRATLPALHGVMANDGKTGRQVLIGAPRTGGTTQSLEPR